MSVNSVGVKALVARIMDRYDRNNDGAINLQGNDGAYNASDTSEKVITNNTAFDDYPKIPDGLGNTWWTPKTTKTQMDLGALFVAANTDKDSKATRDEIEALVSSYDANQSGRLETDELANLQSDFPEKKTESTFVTGWHWKSGNSDVSYGDEVIREDPNTDNRFNIATLPSIYSLEQ